MTTGLDILTSRVPRQRGAPDAAPQHADAAAGDVVPLTQRIGGLSVLRAAITATVVAVAAATGEHDLRLLLLGGLGYAALGALVGAGLLLVRHRGAVVFGIGLLLCADGVMVELGQRILGPGAPDDLVLAVFLGAVCLLGSFRTGIKLAIWQTLLEVIENRGRQTGLFAPLPPGSHDPLGSRLALIWLLVLVICLAAAMNERELRRRRYDAEAMQHFATSLHRDAEPRVVLDRLVEFVVGELDARRALVCAAAAGPAGGLDLLAGTGVQAVPPGRQTGALLTLAEATDGPVAVLAVDPRADPWLAAAMPAARRVLALPLPHDTGAASSWLVLEHQGRSRTRVERRVVAAAAQAGVIAALALSRARLFQASREAALTDGLTGIANRRAFEDRLARTAGPLAVVLADVDHFKAVNDVHGHGTGDDVLRVVARTLAATAPAGSCVARYGGEEFVVLLAGADQRSATAAAERMRAALEASAGGPVRVTASFGVAVADGPVPGLVAAADAALYRAKAAGRNRVELAGE